MSAPRLPFRLGFPGSQVHQLTGEADGVATASDTFRKQRPFAGAATCVGTVVGSFNASAVFSGTASGSATATENALQAVRSISSTLSTTASTVAGAMIKNGRLISTASGTGTITGTTYYIDSFECTLSCSGAITEPGIAVSKTLASILHCTATVTGTLQRPTFIDPSSSSGLGSITGQLKGRRSLQSEADGSATVAGSMVAREKFTGNVAGSSTVTGIIHPDEALSGSVSGTGTATDSSTATFAFAGTASGACSFSATFSVPQRFSISHIDGTGTATGLMTHAIPLEDASAQGFASALGALDKSKPLSGNVSCGPFTGTFNIQTTKPLVGSSVNGTGAINANPIRAARSFSGHVSGIGSATAPNSFKKVESLAGSSSGQGIITANVIKKIASLSAVVSGSGIVEGALHVIKYKRPIGRVMYRQVENRTIKVLQFQRILIPAPTLIVPNPNFPQSNYMKVPNTKRVLKVSK